MANTRIYLKPTKPTLDGTELLVFEDATSPHTTQKQSIDDVVQQRVDPHAQLESTAQVTGLDDALAAIAPLTTKGDLLSFSTVPVRIPVGSNGKVLTADSTQAAGVKWGDGGGGGGSPEAFRVTKAAGQTVTTPAARAKLAFDTVDFQTGVTYNTTDHNMSVDTSGPFGFLLKVPVTPPSFAFINVNIYAYIDDVEVDKFTFSQNSVPGGAQTLGYIFNLTPSNVVDFRIDYAGNDGNDIALLGGPGGMALQGFAVGKSGGGSGDMVGPSSATDGNLCVFDGTTGKLAKDGGPVPVVPLTTKGDIFTRDGSASARQPLGNPGQILSANYASATGLEWIDHLNSPAVAFSARQSPQQSIPNNAVTQVDFQVAEFNVGAAFASNVFTAPRDGYYCFIFKSEMVAPSGADTDVAFRLRKNGSGTALGIDDQVVPLGEFGRPAVMVAFAYLSAAETVDVTCVVLGNAGGALSINNATGSTYFQGFLVASGDVRKTPVSVTSTTKTLDLSDAFSLQVCSNASAQTITVPLNSSVAFPIGTQIDLAQYGAGQVSIAATGGVTINSKLSNLKIVAQFAGCSLIKTGTDTWWLTGDLAA